MKNDIRILTVILYFLDWILNENVQIPERMFQAEKTWKGSVRCFTYMYIFSNSYYHLQCSFYLFSLQKMQLRVITLQVRSRSKIQKENYGTSRHFIFFNYLWYFPPKLKVEKFSSTLLLHPSSLPKKCYPHFSLTWLTLPSQIWDMHQSN